MSCNNINRIIRISKVDKEQYYSVMWAPETYRRISAMGSEGWLASMELSWALAVSAVHQTLPTVPVVGHFKITKTMCMK
jgi:hypothetical protein